MWQTDSIHADGAETTAELAAPQTVVTSKPRHPYQVLRLLPRDATPQQQDSAIQANFQPGVIHYSERPDTLHLPGHAPAKSMLDVSLPTYYKENFFSNDSLYHPELPGGRQGVAGDPLPYKLQTDDTISVIFLFCLVAGVLAVSQSRTFIARQAKQFFRPSHTEAPSTETSGEVRFQLFLVVQTALLLSLFQYFFTQEHINDTFSLSSEYQLIALFLAVWTGYFAVKGLLYSVVNSVFFGWKKNGVWLKSLLFITAMEGVMMLPAGVLQLYFNLSLTAVSVYYTIVVALAKLLTLYKCWHLFFRTSPPMIQALLYFLALEAVPLVSVWGLMVWLARLLQVSL